MNNREAFEAWYKKEIDAGECFMRNKDNPEHYLSLNVHFADKCWQAAIASQQDHIPDVGQMVQSQAQQKCPIEPDKTLQNKSKEYLTSKIVMLQNASKADDRAIKASDILIESLKAKIAVLETQAQQESCIECVGTGKKVIHESFIAVCDSCRGSGKEAPPAPEGE